MPLENDYQRNRYGHMIQSPVFPRMEEAHRRLRQARERVVARSLLVIGLLSAIALSIGSHQTLAVIISGVATIGFIVTCVITGRRSLQDNGGHGKTNHQSF